MSHYIIDSGENFLVFGMVSSEVSYSSPFFAIAPKGKLEHVEDFPDTLEMGEEVIRLFDQAGTVIQFQDLPGMIKFMRVLGSLADMIVENLVKEAAESEEDPVETTVH